MATNTLLHLLTFTLLFTLTISSPSPSPSPAPPPQSGSDDDSLPEPSLSPPPSDLSPDYDSPSLDQPSPPSSSPSPSPLLAPSPVEVSDETAGVEREEAKESDSGGMSGGKKVGVAFGLIGAACFVGFGGVLYRKRQQNIRRARYSQSARLEFF
ncbi:hypothetical protein HanPI659440_Chr01g0025841 [Helianthus annuus]|nr:hypothetical protein HanPI659440_Chr01g0025841 [Helianthus annuus]